MAVKPTPPAKAKSTPVDRSSERSGRYEPRPIGELSGRLVAKPLGKRGFAAAALVADWATIVGPAMAASTLPLRVVFPRGERNQGTLHLKVASGAMALQMQHLGPLIVERVNTHFGYRAVAQLALTQGPVPARAAPRATVSAPVTAEVDPALAGMIESLPDEELKKALAGLGRRLAQAWHRS
jgi:hypothetical protein